MESVCRRPWPWPLSSVLCLGQHCFCHGISVFLQQILAGVYVPLAFCSETLYADCRVPQGPVLLHIRCLGVKGAAKAVCVVCLLPEHRASVGPGSTPMMLQPA